MKKISFRLFIPLAISLSLIFSETLALAQTGKDGNKEITVIKDTINFNLIGKAKHERPLILANNNVIRMEELNINLLDSVSVLQWPWSYARYGDAGINGVIIINTRQQFKTIAGQMAALGSVSSNKEKVLFINGYCIKDSSMQVSKSAIKKIETMDTTIVYAGAPHRVTCINIWTLTAEERKPLSKSSLCSMFTTPPKEPAKETIVQNYP